MAIWGVKSGHEEDDDARARLAKSKRMGERSRVERLIAERPLYRCSHCGFAGQQLHWFCPGCKYWGTVKTLRGSRIE